MTGHTDRHGKTEETIPLQDASSQLATDKSNRMLLSVLIMLAGDSSKVPVGSICLEGDQPLAELARL